MARHPSDSTPKISNELIDTITQAIRVGSYVETAAALAGISKDTFYCWLRLAETADATPESLKLSDAVKRALAESEKRDLDVIDQAAQSGQWQAAAWRLERKFPAKWGRKDKVQLEHTGMDGGPIEIQSMSNEEREARIATLLNERNLLDE